MKKLLAIVVAGISLYQVPIALASPISITGDIAVKYERDTNDGEQAAAGMIYTTKLMAETDFGAGWSAYARLGAQHLTKSGFGDFNPERYGSDDKSVLALDQFGVKYKVGNLEYKLGRQDVTVGKTALLYSRSDANIGKNTFVDGLMASGTVGVMEVSAVVVQEDNVGSLDNKVYAIRAGYSPRESLNLGLTLGRYQGPSIESTNHMAVDGTYKFGKSSLTAEFAKSNNNSDNKAYATTFNYAFNDKTVAYITGFKVEANGDMGGQSDFDNGNQGFHYGVTHSLSAVDSLEVAYAAQKTIIDGLHNNKLEVTLSHGF